MFTEKNTVDFNDFHPDFVNSSYAAQKQMRVFLEQPIETVEEYVIWVRNWKRFYHAMVEAIHHYRDEKNRHKAKGNYGHCNSSWNSKLALRPIAHMFCVARVENKGKLKAGVYKDTREMADA